MSDLLGLVNKLCQLVKFVLLSETDIGSAGKQPMKGVTQLLGLNEAKRKRLPVT